MSMKFRYFFALFLSVCISSFVSAKSFSLHGAASLGVNSISSSSIATTSRVHSLTIIYDTIRVKVCARDSYSGHGFNIGTTRTQNAGDTVVLSRYITGSNDVDTLRTILACIISNPYPVIMGPQSVCQGVSGVLVATGAERYLWDNGDTSSSIHVYFPGDYSVVGVNSNGCVAKSTFSFSVNPPIIHEETRHLCQGEVTYFQGEAIDTSCRREHWDVTPQGCDSQTVVYVEVTAVPLVAISGSASLCSGLSTRLTASGADSYLWSTGETTEKVDITVSDTIVLQGITRFGCSAFDTFVTIVRPTYDTNLYDTICLGESVPFYQRELRSTCSFSVTDHSIYMCDSVVTMNVQVNVQTAYQFTEYVTDSFVWNDSTFTRWGDYEMVFTGSNGCDSVVTLHLGVLYDKPRPTLLVQDNRLLVVDHFPGGGDSARVDYDGYRWYRNGEMIQYGSDAYHQPNYTKLKGCYWVEVLCDGDNWMPSEMMCIDDVYDGILDVTTVSASLSPNPVAPLSSFVININSQDDSPVSVYIYDAAGRQVAVQTSFGNNIIMSAPRRSGLYTIRCVLANSIAVARLIVR